MSERRRTDPGASSPSRPALEDAHESEATKWRAIAGTRAASRPPLTYAGAIMLLTGAAFVLGAQVLYPHTATGQDNAVRDLGLAILAGLAGLRMLFASGPHPVASGVALATGVTMMLFGFLTGHSDGTIAVLEGITGAWIALAAALCIASPSRAPRVRPSAGPGRR